MGDWRGRRLGFCGGGEEEEEANGNGGEGEPRQDGRGEERKEWLEADWSGAPFFSNVGKGFFTGLGKRF